MPGSLGTRTLALGLLAATLALTACGMISPAAPTPTAAPVGRAGAGGGAGTGGPGGGRGARPDGTTGPGQRQGAGQATGQGQADGQAQGQGTGQGRPQGGARGAGGPQAAGTPNPQSPIVNGEVDIVDGRTVTLATNTGWRKVEVPDSATILTEGKGSPADLATGAFVAVTGKPDGTALSIRIFPSGANARQGQFPMNGPQAGNVMTNAKVDAFDGTLLSLDLDGQKASITVPADAEIVKPVPAAFSDIKVGDRVQAFGTVAGDTLTARSLTIVAAPRVGRGAAAANPAP